MDIALLKSTLEAAGEKPYRFAQAYEAVFVGLISDWDEALTLPAALREKLKAEVPLSVLEPVNDVESADGATRKIAFKLADGNTIETVLMRHRDSRLKDIDVEAAMAEGRRTVCVSSQAGCPMKCTFCATGTMGLKRNLTAAEIIGQVLHFARVLKKEDEKVSNVVLMGMGEPMHNYDNFMEALRVFNDQKGLEIGARKLSVSTCGIVPGILKMADEKLQFNLAISLHAPTDELRTRLMPVNRAYPLAKLMAAVETYIEKTGRKVMFEYLLIEGLNDTPEVAEELAKIMQHPLYHVNLIKYHTTGAFVSSPRSNRDQFMDILKKKGVSVTHRITFGEDIDAACGQLANKHEKKAEPSGVEWDRP